MLESQSESISSKVGPFFRSVGQKVASEIEEKIPEMRQAIQGMSHFLNSIYDSESIKQVYQTVKRAFSKVMTVVDSLIDTIRQIYRKTEQSYESFLNTHAALRQNVNELVQKLCQKIKEGECHHHKFVQRMHES